MKKWVLFLFVFVMVSSVSAISSNLGDVYEPGETIIAELSGVILDEIDPLQVKLKRTNVEIAMDYGIKRLEERYFIWLNAPKVEEEYTLIIENILTNVDGVAQREDFQKTFSVVGNLTKYSIKPAVVFASEDFKITASLNGDFSETISVDFPSAREVVLNPGDNEIDFSISGVAESQLVFVSIGKYSVPVYVVGQGAVVDDDGNVVIIDDDDEPIDDIEDEDGTVPLVNFAFSSSVIKTTLLEGTSPSPVIFEIKNTGEGDVTPRFSYNSQILEISPNPGATISSGEIGQFELRYNNVGEGIREAVVVSSGEFSDFFLVIVNFTSNEQAVSTELFDEADGSIFYSCSELRGLICGGEEACSVDTIDSSSGACCVASCVEDSGSGLSIIGWVLGFIVLVILFFVYKKYKKANPEKDKQVKKRFASAEKNLP